MLFSDNPKQALAAWQTARGDAPYPLAAQFGPVQMRKFLPYVAMFRKEAPKVYRITLVGTALVEMFTFDPTGMEVHEVFPDAEKQALFDLYDIIFPKHYISHTHRDFKIPSGVKMVVEQLLLPVGNENGDHDRYVLISDNVPMPVTEAEKFQSEVVLGDLLVRTVYDPATMLPVECAMTTPRSPEDMQRRLTDYKPPA